MAKSEYFYIDTNGTRLFTAVLKPAESGRFPVVILRNPYVDYWQHKSEEEVLAAMENENRMWTDAGYAVVYQHCRGRGKSEGDCIPYINERADGLCLHEWIRKQDFYNGELYLYGTSYLTSVHLVTAPWEKDIRGAVLRVQETERYNCNYRNGFYKANLHGGWYVGMYKHNREKKWNFNENSFRMLPLSAFSETVFGEKAEDFDEILRHPQKDDPFWTETHIGGSDMHGALRNAGIPVLLVTGFYDIYTGGMFDLWNAMEPSSKAMSAMICCPYDHSMNQSGQPLHFPKGCPDEAFPGYVVSFIEHVRTGSPSPVPLGKVTYYRLFENEWRSEDTVSEDTFLRFPIGEGEETYVYDPADVPVFPAGISGNFGGTAYQKPPRFHEGVLTCYTAPFAEDVFVKGKMAASLLVRSDCEDTCFYLRVSLTSPEGDIGLRDDITQISNAAPDYVPGTEVRLSFSFDEHAFLVRAGQRLRIDIASAGYPFYVPHTNRRGLFSEQTSTCVAHNTVVLSASELLVPAESIQK